MRRREFIILIGAAAAAGSFAARAQPANKIARIGFLGSATAAGSSQSVRALREGLKALGYIEGKNRYRISMGRREIRTAARIGGRFDPSQCRRPGDARNARNPGCEKGHH